MVGEGGARIGLAMINTNIYKLAHQQNFCVRKASLLMPHFMHAIALSTCSCAAELYMHT